MKKNKFYWAGFAALAFLAFIFLFYGLGRHAFIDYDEATYAQIVKECLARRDCLSFTYLGNDWFEKPPLYFWLAAANVKIMGETEVAQRLPSALFGLLALALTGLIAYELTKNALVGLSAAAILLLSGEFIFAARQFRMDVPVTASLLLSLYCFVRGWSDSRWYLGVGLGVGLGVMLKSMVGLLVLPVILIFALIYHRWSWLKSAYFWLSAFLALLIILPWHVYQSVKFGQAFWDSYWGWHIIERLRRPIIGQGITVFHYIKYLFYLVEPWIVVFLAGLAWLFFNFKLKLRSYPPALLASGGSALFIFLIFAAARTKLFYYLEPLFPLLAVFIACFGWLIYQPLTATAKKKFLIIFSALLFSGLVNTGWQAFETRDGFSSEFPVANQEKKIGQYLAGQAERKIYAHGWNYFETLRYYDGGRKIITAERINYADAPHYLIISSDLADYYRANKEFRNRTKEIIKEKGVSLYEVK